MIVRARHLGREAIFWEIILSFGGICAFAQAPTGTLAGRVVDPTGAAILGAHIAINNQQMGSKRALRTAWLSRFISPAPEPGKSCRLIPAATALSSGRAVTKRNAGS